MNRLASMQDAKEITNLIAALREESRYKAFPLNREKLFGFVKVLIADQNSLVQLICDKSEIVGLFIANIDEMYFSDSTTASDFIFYVSPNNRKSGIGTRLIELYIDWAKDNNASDIRLSTSTGISDNAIVKLADKHDMTKTGIGYGMINNV